MLLAAFLEYDNSCVYLKNTPLSFQCYMQIKGLTCGAEGRQFRILMSEQSLYK